MFYHNFYIITGGPGAGKTTLLNALKGKGYCCVEESARLIIQDQVNCGGDGLPWSNIKKYKELMLEHVVHSYEKALLTGHQVTFFDRGILDLIAYDRRTKMVSSSKLQQAVLRMSYNKKVFIAPPWEEIFCNDNERKQTFSEAVDIYKGIREVYHEWGFELIELPKETLERRISFIQSHVASPYSESN